MSDITMCASDTCRRRTECYRNAASGTEPSPWRQAYFFGRDMKDEEDCKYFSPQDTKKYVKENNDRKEV
jgi:hypothetical protein